MGFPVKSTRLLVASTITNLNDLLFPRKFPTVCLWFLKNVPNSARVIFEVGAKTAVPGFPALVGLEVPAVTVIVQLDEPSTIAEPFARINTSVNPSAKVCVIV